MIDIIVWVIGIPAETMGLRTGIDLDALIAARAVPEAAMPRERFHGALARAGAPLTEWRL
jgi:hypothetical protein